MGKNYYRLRIDYQDGSSQYHTSAPLYFEPTGIQAFPNPAKETLYINLEELREMPAEIKLISLQGVELMQKRVGASHSDVIELDLINIQNGIYALWIKADGFKAVHQKVVIMKNY